MRRATINRGYVTGIPVIGQVRNRPNERRRSSRYRCSGLAEVLRIPATGTAVKATVSDLSLHGCRILTDCPFEFGVSLELLLQVKSISFRATGNVKVVLGTAGIGIEFTQMSAGGQRRLAELLADLDRLSSMPGWKKPAPQTIEGECSPQYAERTPATNAPICGADENRLAPPMRRADANHVPRPQARRRQHSLPARPREVDVFF